MKYFLFVLIKFAVSACTALMSTFGVMLIIMIVCMSFEYNYYFEGMTDGEAASHYITVAIATMFFIIIYEVLGEDLIKPIISRPQTI